MPTTALGLLIFIVLLAPGLTYSAYRKRRTPVDKPSTLRELGGIALPSVLCDVGAIAGLAVVHQLRPHVTPDIGALIAHPGRYVQQHYAELFWWGVGLLAFACVLALLAAALIGSSVWARAVRRRPLSWLTPTGGVSLESAWWLLFTNEPGVQVYAGCTLDDGSYLGGYVLSYSPNSDETADRELVLTGEISYRGPDDTEATELDVGAVTISARRLQYMTVSYLEAAPPPEQPPAWSPRVAKRLLHAARWPILLGLIIAALAPLPWFLRLIALIVCLAVAGWVARRPSAPADGTGDPAAVGAPSPVEHGHDAAAAPDGPIDEGSVDPI